MDTLTLRRRLLPFTLAALLLVPGHTTTAQVITGAHVGVGDAFAYESITVAATPIGFTAALLNPARQSNAKFAIITVDLTTGADFRYRVDGTDPSTTEGHLVTNAAATERLITVIGINNLTRFRAVRTAAVSATLKVTYYR
jgi:hypothetical protein